MDSALSQKVSLRHLEVVDMTTTERQLRLNVDREFLHDWLGAYLWSLAVLSWGLRRHGDDLDGHAPSLCLRERPDQLVGD